jgi:polysaccharide biosynthesis/export protein
MRKALVARLLSGRFPQERAIARAGVAVALVLACAFPVPGQANDTTRVEDGGGWQPVRSTPVPVAGGRDYELLTQLVDRQSYVLGPGDRLEISLVGELNRSHSAMVSPEGTLVLPGMGVVAVGGETLDVAQDRVSRLVSRFYRNVEVHVTLSDVRRFRVFVVGDPSVRGTQVATSATRVSEVVPTRTGEGVMRRNVIVRRMNGDSIIADLQGFQQTGDLSRNPLLREGDVIVVPAIDRTVQVVGRLRYPGLYEYREGESLASLLSIANGGGPFPSDAGDSVRVTRFAEGERREVLALSRVDADGGTGAALSMQPFDAVFVPGTANFREQPTATIRGQVARPGTYPIRQDTTTVRELIAMAGGLTQNASLIGARLQRDSAEAGNAALERLAAIPEELRSPEERQILQISAAGEHRSVVTNFEQLFARGEDATDQRLWGSDLVTVPRRRDEVLVLGAVHTPGIVGYAPGQRIAEVVDRAGGYTRRANRRGAVVLRARTGARLNASEVGGIEPGDAVVVPYRERVTALQVMQTTGMVVSTVSSMILAYIAISNR